MKQSTKNPNQKILTKKKQAVSFRERVLAIVRKIQKGSVLSYGEVAARAGRPRGARAVGFFMSKNFDPKIPCHRVIRSDGKLGGYNKGAKNKARILAKEGFILLDTKYKK